VTIGKKACALQYAYTRKVFTNKSKNGTVKFVDKKWLILKLFNNAAPNV